MDKDQDREASRVYGVVRQQRRAEKMKEGRKGIMIKRVARYGRVESQRSSAPWRGNSNGVRRRPQIERGECETPEKRELLGVERSASAPVMIARGERIVIVVFIIASAINFLVSALNGKEWLNEIPPST
ncbi:hypothetical protein B0H14DRAFT_2629988 [Mycena olivaceomarginata]|nr:hypothetical protein B0H14DRAFT_2629988 [Mycena olivaceomarginata]